MRYYHNMFNIFYVIFRAKKMRERPKKAYKKHRAYVDLNFNYSCNA